MLATKVVSADPLTGSRTLFDKVWDSHVITQDHDGSTLLYIDRHLLHEVTSPQAFAGLAHTQTLPWRPLANLATPDHNVPTTDRALPIQDPFAREQIRLLSANCAAAGIPLLPLSDRRQGIVHVTGPEMGATLPGSTVVCGDSHTSTHGAFASIAHGIGTSEIEHVLATQTLRTYKPRTMRVNFRNRLADGVTAKDMALALIRHIGTAGATGFALELAGDAVSALTMEGRMTLCNMSIEAGARCALIAVDETTLRYLKDRELSPRGNDWQEAIAHWANLHSDDGATFDADIELDASAIGPMISWGTSPEMTASVDEVIPCPGNEPDPVRRAGLERALRYIGLEPGTRLGDIAPNVVFIGSCTNSRIEDLRAAAAVLQGKHIASSIQRALVVPGSGSVKLQAEAEGLDKIFRQAGFEWREPGCSMCVGMNPDELAAGQRCASTSNRNFEDRQGVGGRTHLASPAMVAAAAVAGHFVDIRTLNTTL